MNYDYTSRRIVDGATNALCMVSKSNIEITSEIAVKFKSMCVAELNGDIYYFIYFNWLTRDEFYVLASDKNTTVFLARCKSMGNAISYTKAFEVFLRKIKNSTCKIHSFDIANFKYFKYRLNKHDYIDEPVVLYRT